MPLFTHMEQENLMSVKKKALSEYLSVEQKYILQEIDNDFTRFSVCNFKTLTKRYDVYTKQEREHFVRSEILMCALTNQWEFDTDTIKLLLEITQEELENYIISERLLNDDFIVDRIKSVNGEMSGFVDGAFVKGLVHITIGDKEFFNRLFNYFERKNQLANVLSYDGEEIEFDGFYIYKVL